MTRPTRGVIAAGDPQTVAAGARALRAGGNAADAAVAAALAAFVCELPLASPMGGGVLMAWSAGGPPTALDFFARTPGLGGGRPRDLDFCDVEVDFGATVQIFHVGRASAAVPLALPGLLDAHQRWGWLPLPVVAEPSVELGRSGYVLGERVAYVFSLLEPIVTRSTGCRRLYFDRDRIAVAGVRMKNPDLANAIEQIAATPATVRDVYAQLVREFSPPAGGLMGDADVARLAVIAERPVSFEHLGVRLATMPPPSSGGALVALGLKLLERLGQSDPFLSAGHVLRLAQVQDALLHVRDERFEQRCWEADFVTKLLDPQHLDELRRWLSTPAAGEGAPGATTPLGSTTQISTLDEHGGAVAVTLSNGEGCGHVLKGTGMVVNNMLGEEDLHRRGFHVDPPGQRLATMMTPTILRDSQRTIALGSGGSNRLRTAILQVVSHLVEYRVSAQLAVDAPRVHLEPLPGAPIPGGRPPRSAAFECPGMSAPAQAALRAAYPQAPVAFPQKNMFFGGVHLALQADGEFSGAGDDRRGGSFCVVG
jgi:gamma-glutamyltranspeptidase/glutathione hydrolase